MAEPGISLRWRWIEALRSAPLTGDPRWSTATFAVAVALWMFANEDGESIRPSDARVGEIVQCSKIHARNKRRDLLSLGMIECVGEATAKGMAPEFRLVPPELWGLADEDTPADEDGVIGCAEDTECIPADETAERCPEVGTVTGLQCTLQRWHLGGCDTSRRGAGGVACHPGVARHLPSKDLS